MRIPLPALAAVLMCVACSSLVRDPAVRPLPVAAPASVGLSAERLQHMSEYFRTEAARGTAAGYVLMVARYGKLVHSSAVGYRDIERQVPMTLDTRFRIASMTKPVTSVAVLMLYEEGHFYLDEAVARFLPEFANPRVYTGTDAEDNLTTEPARRDITIRDLLTHTSGLGYLGFYDTKTPLGQAYGALPVLASGSLAEKVRLIASMPLYFHPGDGWRYSFADDVLGRLVEVVSGMPFDRFLNERLFVPLNMKATGFYLPSSAKPLLATIYKHDPEGALIPADSSWLGDPGDTSRAPSGGGGLFSTAGDYLRFAQMLANGGSLEGRQYLSPVTVTLMTANQVAEDAQFKFWGPNSTGLGYGFGVGVEIDTRHSWQAGSPGDYSWDGLFDTHWIVSPKTGVVAVLLAQVDRSGNKAPQRTYQDFRNLLFATVTTSHDSTSLRRQAVE
jgi:CubicO group peptidase (beta-lactamase class C family)